MNTIPIGYVILEVVQNGRVSNGTLPPVRNGWVRFNPLSKVSPELVDGKVKLVIQRLFQGVLRNVY